MAIKNMDFRGPQINEGDVVAAETALGVSLPPDYRRFLLKWNGGRPEPGCFRFADSGDDGSVVNIFYSVNASKPGFDLVRRATDWRARVPNDLIAFGDDAGGSLLGFGIQGPRRGKVYFWALDDESEPRDPTNYDNVWLCADSFHEFIDGLYEAG